MVREGFWFTQRGKLGFSEIPAYIIFDKIDLPKKLFQKCYSLSIEQVPPVKP
jgi:hypothetical protein